MKYFPVIAIALLVLVVVIPVSASNAEATAKQIQTLLDKKLPYTLEITPAQMNTSGYNSLDLTNRGTYKITIKSAVYDASEETIILNIQASRNGNSIKTNSPYHFYLPSSLYVRGANANAQLQNFLWGIIVIMDRLPLGDPIADDTYITVPSEDAWLQEDTDADYATIRNAPGDAVYRTSTTTYASLQATTSSQTYSNMIRSGSVFNTSALKINSSSGITSASLSVNVYSKMNGLGSFAYGVTGFSPSSNSTLVAGDYDSFLNTELAPQKAYADISTGSTTWNLNADGLAYIDQSSTHLSNTRLMIRDSPDIANSNSSITWSSGAISHLRMYAIDYTTDPSKWPTLSIVYTTGPAADTTPPSSITALTNQSVSCNTMDFSWTNPTDADYGNLMIWRNNTALTNLTNTTTYVNWTGLPEAIPIAFSSKTCDLSGNCNASFVNLTATGDTCPVTPTPTTTAPTPTPTPTSAPVGCLYTNITTTIDENNTEWSIHEGNWTWGTAIVNRTQGNISWYSCYATPTPTAKPPRTPDINPSVRNKPWLCDIPILNWILNNCEV